MPERVQPQSPAPWLAPRDLDPQAHIRLLCFPHAGSGAAAYYRWKRRLAPAGIAVCPVLVPGRENRSAEPPMRSLPQLVDAFARAAGPALIAPYALFGHSMGSLLALEAARRLAATAPMRPQLLIVSGRSAPGTQAPLPALHGLPEEELIAALERRFGSSPGSVLLHNPELRALFLPTLRADLELIATHTPEPDGRLNLPILAIGGTEDPSLTPEGLRGWARQTSGTCTVRWLPGGHFDHLGPAEDDLLAVLTEALG